MAMNLRAFETQNLELKPQYHEVELPQNSATMAFCVETSSRIQSKRWSIIKWLKLRPWR